jgi:hypothetical protein
MRSIGQKRDISNRVVRCFSSSDLAFVRDPGANFLYVLDRKRVFNRWTVTQAVFPFDVVLLVQTYLANAKYSLSDRWRRFGTATLLNAQVDMEALSADWPSLTVLSQTEYDREARRTVTGEMNELIEFEFASKAIATLLREGVPIRRVIRLSHGELLTNSEMHGVRLQYESSNGTVREASFDFPINPEKAPYVGWPLLMGDEP